MIVILKQNTKKEDLDRFISMLNSYHVKIADISGEQHSIFGLIGDTSKIDIDLLRAQPVVADIKRVQEPYKSCNRKFHPEDTIVDIDHRDRRGCKGCRRYPAPGRCVQAPYLPLRIPGAPRRRH